MQLVWHSQGSRAGQTDVLPAYRLESDARPVEVWARRDDTGEPLTNLETGKVVLLQDYFDINADGVSIFTDGRPFFREGEAEMFYAHFAKLNEPSVIDAGCVVTLDFDDSIGTNLTIILYLEAA